MRQVKDKKKEIIRPKADVHIQQNIFNRKRREKQEMDGRNNNSEKKTTEEPIERLFQ